MKKASSFNDITAPRGSGGPSQPSQAHQLKNFVTPEIFLRGLSAPEPLKRPRQKQGSDTAKKAKKKNMPSQGHSRDESDISDAGMAATYATDQSSSRRSSLSAPTNSTPPHTGTPASRSGPLGWPSPRPVAPAISMERPSDPAELRQLIASITTGRQHKVSISMHAHSVSVQCYDMEDHAAVSAILADRRQGFHSTPTRPNISAKFD